MSEEMKPYNFDDLEKASVQLSDTLVPVRVFVQKTTHSNQNATAYISQQFRKEAAHFGLPESLIEKFLLEHAPKKLAEAGMVEGKAAKVEVDALVLAKNKEGEFFGYANIGASALSRAFEAREPRLIGNCRDEETARMMFGMTEMALQYSPDWNGERQAPVVIEAETMGEFLTKLETSGVKDEFLKLYPDTITSDSPIPSGTAIAVKTISPQNRAALVKRFGRQKIEALEKKLKANAQ